MPGFLLVLSGSDVDSVLSTLDPSLALRSQSEVFISYSSSHSSTTSNPSSVPSIQAPVRISLQSEDTTMLFMPSRVNHQTACKIVSVPKGPGADGLPATTVVMDEVTGRAKAIVNARKLTALRNAAGSALSVQAAGVSPSHLVIFGSGAQAEAHARLFFSLFPLASCTLIVRSLNSRATSLFTALSTSFPDKVSLFSSSDPGFDLPSTLERADVILTLTPSTRPLFDSKYVKPGTHLVLVGSYTPSMREVDEEMVKRAGTVVVDSKEACGKEAGELKGLGEERMQELGEVLRTGKMVKTGDVTIFKSVGIGLQDVAITNLVLAEAERLGLGTKVDNYD